jgi:alanine racemase
VAIGGRPYAIVTVELGTLTVEVGDAPVRPGDSAVFFGGGADGEPTLQAWADELGTIGEEIVTRLSPRIPRVYAE